MPAERVIQRRFILSFPIFAADNRMNCAPTRFWYSPAECFLARVGKSRNRSSLSQTPRQVRGLEHVPSTSGDHGFSRMRDGKLRLDKETYSAVQTIYYPGFTVGGFAEVLSVIA